MVKIQNYEFGIMNCLSVARRPSSVARRRSSQPATAYEPRTPFLRLLLLFLLSQIIIHNSAFSQQPQAQAGQAIFPVNAKFVQGFGPGYWPTAGSNLTLNLAPGTAVCSNVVQTYAGGTLTLAPSATNYVYLNPPNNCAPGSNTTGFTTASIPIATVVTTSAAISSITDVRTMFVSNGGTSSGTVTSVGMTGDGIIFNPTVSGSPITSSGTLAPQLLTQAAKTVLAGPASGPAATPTFRALASADLPASITSSTSGNAATATALATVPSQCAGSAFALGVAASGNANCLGSQTANTVYAAPNGSSGAPIFRGLTSSDLPTIAIAGGGTGQTTANAGFNALSPLTTEGDLLYYHSSANARLARGSNGQCLTSNGVDPVWGSCSTGSGTVTSVGLSMPSMFSVSGSPVTGSGTLTAALANQNANLFMAGPASGNAAAPAFRGLVGADLPAPTASTLGGVESMTCGGGQFLNQISTGGVPACATPTGGGSSSGLGNGSTVIDASLQAGTDFSSKVNAAIAALSPTGGVVDARGLGGSQSMSANIVMPPNVTLLLGSVTVTESPGTGIGVNNGDAIIGLSRTESVITGNGTSPMIYQASNGVSDVHLAKLRVGNFNNAINSPGVPQPMDMALYFPQAMNVKFEDVDAYASYGFYYGSATATPFRRDLPYLTGCNCYGEFIHSSFTGWAAGAVLGMNTNSNTFTDDLFGGLQSGSAVYIDNDTFANFFYHPDVEVQNVGFDISGQNVNIDTAYFEDIGLRGDAPTWTAGYSYLAGEVIKDSNGNEQKCWQGGTSGGTQPTTWATAAGAQTTDNTVIWRRTVAPAIIRESGAGVVAVTGAGYGETGVSEDLSSVPQLVVTPSNTVLPSLTAGRLNSSNGQFLAGGLINSEVTITGAPTLSYHLAGGTHTTTYYYYVNLNTTTSSTGLSPQATISNAPDALGQVETATIQSGGSGYALNDTITLNCYTPGISPVLTVSGVSSSVVTGVTISNAGTDTGPGSCGQASTSGSGSGISVLVDTNYIVIAPPTINSAGFGTFTYQYPGGGNWDIVGRTNVNNMTIGTYQEGLGVTSNNFCPSAGTFCDLGWSTVAYTPPARNSTGDVSFGSNSGGDTAYVNFNTMRMYGSAPNLTFVPNTVAGNSNINVGFAPQGPGNQAFFSFYFNSDQAANHRSFIEVNSTVSSGGMGLFGPSVYTGDVYGNQHNMVDDGNGNASFAGKVTAGASGFCITSNCITSWPTFPSLPLSVANGGTGQTTAPAAFNTLSPLTTEGDLHYYHSSSNTRLAIGGANAFLTSNGTDPSWGALTGSGFGSQTANNFLAAPNGSSGNPSFRTLVAADLPASITSNTSGNAATATALAATPTQCSGNNFATGVAASGNANCAAPSGGGQAGAYTSVSFSATPTFTASSNTNSSFSITLTGNVTSSTLASAAAGQYLAFKICQDGTGGRTFAWPTGFSAATTVFPTLSTCTEQAFFWDGSNAQPLGPAQVSGSSLSALWYGPTGSAPGTPPSGFIAAWFDSTDNALKVKNSSGTVTAAVGTASCSNQVITAISDSAAATCTTLTLASTYFANQGTTTTVLHGNAAGNPSWAGVSLANDTAANQGTTTTVLHGNASGQPSFGSVATGDIGANAVTSAKMTAEITYHVCDIYINGVSTGAAITNAQLGPETRQCYIPFAATILEMDVSADAGTPNIIIGRNHAGTIANIVSSALATAGSGGIACSNTGGTTGLDGATTCGSTLQNTSLSRGDYLQEVSGTAGGTAKAMSVHVIYSSSN